MTLKKFYQATRIEQIVAKIYGITPDSMRIRSRADKVRIPRQICMYLMLLDTDLTQKEVGARFSLDHSTTIASRKVITNFIETDKQFNDFMNYLQFGIKNELSSSFLNPPEAKEKFIVKNTTVKLRNKVEVFRTIKESPFRRESKPMPSNTFRSGQFVNF